MSRQADAVKQIGRPGDRMADPAQKRARCGRWCVGVFLLAGLAMGCATSRPQLSSSASEALAQVQSALDQGGGYTIDANETNFVLSHWGGVGSGSIQVSPNGQQALAHLERTGEPGATYEMFFTGGSTYFKRSTCDQTFRVPGGGPEVLLPFMLEKTHAVANATDATVTGNVIVAHVQGLGRAAITVDPSTLRPSSMVGTTSSGLVVWFFHDWGRRLSVSSPAHSVEDRGPGGIPC